jgi:hypothetical protein
LAAAFAMVVSGWLAARADAFVYWPTSTNGTIGRANLDGSGVNQSLITGLVDPTDVAVDGQHIYWSSYYSGVIGRANLDGTGVNPTFITGLNGPLAVAVDGQHLYWASNSGIGRANLDGTGVNPSFIPGGVGVAVDSQYIYWVGGGGIGRANLDGTGVNQTFITGAGDPQNVVVDGQHIYWSNPYPSPDIGRANLDGTGVNPSFITGVPNASGVAVDGQYLYWSSLGANTIGRANLDGTSVSEGFIATAAAAFQLAVDALQPPTASITNPVSGATYDQGQVVDSSFSCGEGASGPGIASCLDQSGHASGTAVDTSTPGLHMMTVTATSLDGATGVAGVSYTVIGPPKASIVTPASGAKFVLGQSVAASYSCSDGSGGPGIAACIGTAPNGAVIDTATLGTHVFTVIATSQDGQSGSASSTYTVAPPPSPVLGNLHESHARWRDGSGLAQISIDKKRPPIGTTFGFTLDQPGTVELAFTQNTPGRLVGGKSDRQCIAQTEHNQRRRACTRALNAGTVSLSAHVGTDKIIFDGRVSLTHKLGVGRYTVTVTATNTDGESSKPQLLSFTIVK